MTEHEDGGATEGTWKTSVSGSTTFGIDCSRGEGGLLILKQPSHKNKIKRKTHTQ